MKKDCRVSLKGTRERVMGPLLGFFWTLFLCGVKTQMRRYILSHLFKWIGVILG